MMEETQLPPPDIPWRLEGWIPLPAMAAQPWILLDINIVVVYLLHYISVERTTVDIRSTLVPSVACQTTEGEYHLLTTLPTY